VKAFLEFVGKLWPLYALTAAVLVGAGGIGWYSSEFSLRAKMLEERVHTMEERVHALEERVHTLTVAPAIANSAEKTTLANPVAQACADFARRLLGGDGDVFGDFNRDHIRSAMMDLGCTAPRPVTPFQGPARPPH
jgi:hypothetical protein